MANFSANIHRAGTALLFELFLLPGHVRRNDSGPTTIPRRSARNLGTKLGLVRLCTRRIPDVKGIDC
jgi:hypothetical protein